MTDLSPDAKDLLQVARGAFSPTDRRVAAVRSALAARLDVTHTAAEISAAGGWSAARSGLIAIALISTTFVAGMFLNGSHQEQAAPSTAPVTAAPVPAPPQPEAFAANVRTLPATASEAIAQPGLRTPALPTAALVVAQPRRIARNQHGDSSSSKHSTSRKHNSSSAALGRTQPTAALEPAQSSAVLIAAQPLAALTRAPAVNPNTHNTTETSVATSRASSTENAAHVSKQAATQTAAQAASADDSLQREIVLVLKRARAALARHDARTALALADEHAALFPSGRLRQEREAVRVLALCELGRTAEARAATQELERIAPRSPHLMRIRTACRTQPAAEPAP